MLTNTHYHIIPRSNGIWSVHRIGAAKVTRNYSTRQAAIAEGKRLTRASGGSELAVHGKDGRVVSRLAVDSSSPLPTRNGNSK